MYGGALALAAALKANGLVHAAVITRGPNKGRMQVRTIRLVDLGVAPCRAR